VVAGKGDTESSEPSAMAQHPLQNTRISCRRDNYTVVKLSRRFRIPFAHRAKPCGWPLRPWPFSSGLLRWRRIQVEPESGV